MSRRRSRPSGVATPKVAAPSAATVDRRTAPVWVKILVALHLFAILIWTLPKLPDDVISGRVTPRSTQWLLYWNQKYLKNLNPVQAYLFSTGTWQYWDMFAPNPANWDWYCTADVTYSDGTKKEVPYPRIFSLPISQKLVKERYRKYYERAHDDNTPILWAPFAQAMALKAYTDPKNPPIQVDLVRHWHEIAAPGLPQDPSYGHWAYFHYAVDRRMLRKAKGEK